MKEGVILRIKATSGKLFKIFVISIIIISNSLIYPIGFTKTEAATSDSNVWLTYKIDEFSRDTIGQLFDVLGSAEVPDGESFIRLTPAETLQSGAVITKNNFCPKDNYSFSTAFSFKMSNQSPDGPSDGLTFTLQSNPTNPLTNGGGIGIHGTAPSFSVKYDTFKNEVYNDPSENNIAITTNGVMQNNNSDWYTDLNQVTSGDTSYVLSDGTQYYTWIDYDGLSQNVQIRLGTSPDRSSSDLVLDVNNIDLGTIFDGDRYYASFTGTTGSPNYETHDIYNWYFVNRYEPIATLNPQNDYRQAPSSLEIVADTDAETGLYNATATLLDPLGNPVQGATLDSFTSSNGELMGPNGEAITDLESDVDGKISAMIRNAGHSQDITLSANFDCFTDSTTFTTTNQPPTAPDDTKTTGVNEPVSGQVDGQDLDGDNLTYQTGSEPSNGTVVVN
ncbi:lectin-like domain-containing protein [Lysinibacillus telephonicus]|uniref:lectin-like domain-containing protein n=1 Tax=Lysinibacillus telephonicus TaxID=1714840 RepID=UPI0037DD1F29